MQSFGRLRRHRLDSDRVSLRTPRLAARRCLPVSSFQAIEPLIGHTKADHRMDRCWLKGAHGEALHAVLCAAGIIIRWLLRAIAKMGLAVPLLAMTVMALYAGALSRAASRPQRGVAA